MYIFQWGRVTWLWSQWSEPVPRIFPGASVLKCTNSAASGTGIPFLSRHSQVNSATFLPFALQLLSNVRRRVSGLAAGGVYAPQVDSDGVGDHKTHIPVDAVALVPPAFKFLGIYIHRQHIFPVPVCQVTDVYLEGIISRVIVMQKGNR